MNGEIDAATRTKVADGLCRIHRSHFGADPTVEFTEVEAGRWYTGGQPSTASMVLGSVPPGTDQSVRETVMDEMARFFSSATDTDYHHVMVVAADARH